MKGTVIKNLKLDGNAGDVKPQLAGSVYDLGGGGADVDRAIQWTINQVRGCEDCSKTVDLRNKEIPCFD